MGRLAHLAATGQFGHGPARVATGVTGPAEDKDQGAGGHAQPSIAVDSSGQHIVIASNYAEGFGLNPFRCPASNIPTRTPTSRWERSTIWNILRNPAYQGKACFGKTELRPRQRITRRLRQRNRLPTRDSANHERPRQDWIEIPVPALVSEDTFALAQEQLQKNKHHSPRRTIEPTLLQGMLVCQNCGYALYRTSTKTSKRKLYYYRCLGSDASRYLKGSVCSNRPIRQDYLDEYT